LWFGWFGFNAGSALASGALASQALVSTQLAACAGLLTWIAVEKKATGHATTLGAASGAVVGLVAITPAAGYVNSMAALVIGSLGGLAGVFAVRLKFRLRYDDSLDVVGVHGVGGVVGMLSLGVLASATVNPLIAHTGLIDGGGLGLLGRQALAVIATGSWAFAGTFAIATLVSRSVGLRVDERAELVGLDSIVHAETAYETSATVGTLGKA
jgi:Amt family ammonium transporter